MLGVKFLSKVAPGLLAKKLIHQLHHPSVKKTSSARDYPLGGVQSKLGAF